MQRLELLTPFLSKTKRVPRLWRERVFLCGGEDRIRIPSPQWGRATEQKRAPRLWRERVFLSGGEDRIRTCDRGFRPGNRLAGGPIRPLWHLPRGFTICDCKFSIDHRKSEIGNRQSEWRREWDSNPRWCDPNMFSRHAPSAARPSLHKAPACCRGGSDFTIFSRVFLHFANSIVLHLPVSHRSKPQRFILARDIIIIFFDKGKHA